MEELQRLHQETKTARLEKEKQKVDKKEALKNRLKKVRDKKRLKMGLPMLPDDDDDDESRPPEKTDEEARAEEEVNPEDLILQRLKEIREKEEEAKRKLVVREWDVGKKGGKVAAVSPFGASSSSILTSKPAEAKVFSQKEWVEKKRSERPNEFAPPTNFSQDSGAKGTGSASKKFTAVPPPASLQREQWPQPNQAQQRQQHQPQPNFAHQREQQRQPNPAHHQQNIPWHQPQQNFAHQPQIQQPYPGTSRASFDFAAQETVSTSCQADDEGFEATRIGSISRNSRLEMHRQMNEGSFGHIVNEVTDAPVELEPSSSATSGVTGSSRGVEIPPPCSFDYYTSAANKRSNWKGSRTR